VPWRYEIDELRQLVRVRLHGEVSNPDLLAADDALRGDPKFRRHFDQLVDMSDATEGVLSPEAIRELVGRPPLFATTSRRAIVARTDLGFGLARIFQARRGAVAGEIEIFRSLARAELWLSEKGERS
jgi:hypothetical protein